MNASALLVADAVGKHFTPPRALTDRLRGRPSSPVKALRGVSLVLGAGEALGLIGESGSGKSTLARCLVALHPCDDGRVLHRGRDLAAMGRRERRTFHQRVQFVFQNPFAAMNPRMTVRQALSEVLRVHRICPPDAVDAEAAALLDRVHLPRGALDRRPHQFSGGQLQRVALARALALRPEAMIADEVVSALDVSVQAQIVNLLLELQRELGLAILFIAHDLHLVRHVSHRIAVMYRGTLVETGARDAVLDAPLHPYTRRLVRSTPSLVPARPSVPLAPVHTTPPAPTSTSEPMVADDLDAGCVFRPRCERATARCAVEPPLPRAFAGGHLVACHHAEPANRNAA